MTRPYFCFLKCGHAALAHYSSSDIVDRPRHFCSTHLVSTLDVHAHDQVPVGILHVLEADISEDTSIVDQDVYPAKVLDRCLNDLVTVLDRIVVCNSATARCLDLLDDYIGGLELGQSELRELVESIGSPLRTIPRL